MEITLGQTGAGLAAKLHITFSNPRIEVVRCLQIDCCPAWHQACSMCCAQMQVLDAKQGKCRAA
jgi:hypothetical protein